MKKFAVTSFLCAALIVGFLAFDFAKRPNSSLTHELWIDIAPQSSFQSVLRSLNSQGISIPSFEAKLAARIFGFDRKIRAGEFLITPGQSSLEILRSLSESKGRSILVLVKEGYNIWDIQNGWSVVNPSFDKDHYQQVLHDPKLLAKAQVPTSVPEEYRSLEGYLFPETYSIEKYDSISGTISMMIDEFNKRARPILMKHPWANTPEGFYKLLTLASIVEKESGNGDEQPLVASVFWNRLNKNMKLQSDPTTIYALFPNFDGNLKRIHLEAYTAYNTYRIPELPVTPIANPGERALRAVVNPAVTRYLYFVGKGDGRHIFAESYEEHSRNVRRFQLGQK